MLHAGHAPQQIEVKTLSVSKDDAVWIGSKGRFAITGFINIDAHGNAGWSLQGISSSQPPVMANIDRLNFT